MLRERELSKHQNAITYTVLAVSLITIIGVHLRTMLTMRGTRISTMATRTTTIRTTQIGFGLSGVLDKAKLSLDIYYYPGDFF